MDYIIPHRPSTNDRINALTCLLQYLSDKPVNPVVIEDSDSDLFCRSHLFNKGIAKTSSNIVWLADNDIIVDPSAFQRALELLAHPKVSIYKPFKPRGNRVYDLPYPVYKKLAYGEITTVPDIYPPRKGLGLFCGVTAVKRQAIESLGGFDEDFIGWGSQGYALANVSHRFGFTCHADDFAAYHFNHRRLLEDTCQHPRYKDNQRLWSWYRDATIEQIQERVSRNRTTLYEHRYGIHRPPPAK